MDFRRTLIIAGLLVITPAAAQQQPDIDTLQRAVGVLSAQRNQANDREAAAEIRASRLADDLAKAQARLKELEAKGPEK